MNIELVNDKKKTTMVKNDIDRCHPILFVKHIYKFTFMQSSYAFIKTHKRALAF